MVGEANEKRKANMSSLLSLFYVFVCLCVCVCVCYSSLILNVNSWISS